MQRWLDRVREAIVLALVCVSPWAFGAVEAWAELAQGIAILLLALLGLVAGLGSRRAPRLLAFPGLALLGLALLAVLQATPLPREVLARVAPGAASTWEELVPAAPQGVEGLGGTAIAPAATTISQIPEVTAGVAARVGLLWVLFQSLLGQGGGVRALRRLGLALTINSVGLALFSMVQAMTWDGRIFWFRPSPMDSGWSTGGPFVGHGPLAAYLDLGLGFALAALVDEGRRRGARMWAFYATGVIVLGIVASQSRTGTFAMLGAAAVLVVLLRPRLRLLGAGLGGVIGIVGFLLLALGQVSPLLRVLSVADSSSYAARLDVWGAAIRTWLCNPVLGTGLGTFGVAAAPFQRHDLGVFYTRAENEYVDLLTEGGILGLGLGLAGAVALVLAARRALATTESTERAPLLGAIFGLTALAIHSLSDFAMHIPGVAIPALILSARLVGAGNPRRVADSTSRAVVVGTWGLLVAVAFLGLPTAVRLARAEATLAGTDLPLPGTTMPATALDDASAETLDRRRQALERALAIRPDWAEGHLRLGLVHLGLYRIEARGWFEEALGNPDTARVLADPLRLGGLKQAGPALADYEPVRRHVLPAVRSLLQARRRGPTLPQTHAWLAALDTFQRPAEPCALHAGRALRLAGCDPTVLVLAGRAAQQGGESKLAARCWRRSLEVSPETWVAVADAAGVSMTPEAIVAEVLPKGGRMAINFADRLAAGPEDGPARQVFLRAALERLPAEAGLDDAERNCLEARARAGLDDRTGARRAMLAALELEPGRAEWRRELISWSLGWRDFEAVRQDALACLVFQPGDPLLTQALEAAAEGLARGETGDGPADSITDK